MPPMPRDCCMADIADAIVAARTDRLTLRTWRQSDLAPYAAALNTPAVTRWLGGVESEFGMAAMLQRIEAQQAEHGHCFWIIERNSNGAILGFCGLKRVNTPGTRFIGELEIGWRLREDVWGHGYAREAASAALDWAFTHTDACRVVAMTVPQNSASWGLMMRLGMVRAPELDFDHPDCAPPLKAHIVYTIDKEDWTQ